MKKLLIIILYIFSIFTLKAQYGAQFADTINGIVCLIHLPNTYNTDPGTQKYPILIMCQGAGEYGTNPARAAIHGVGYAIKVGTWDGNAYNPTTGVQEKFITISALSAGATAGLSMDQVDQLFTYAIATYRVDTTVKAVTGLSRGGGAAWDFAIHVTSYNWGTSPPTPTFKTPKHIPSAIVVASSESNYFDPVEKFVADGTWVWGFGDVLSGDSHAQTTRANMDSVNKYTNPDRARFTSYRCLDAGKYGHCGWDESVYDSTVKETIDGKSMNIYQFLLYHRKGTVAPPANSITTGSVPTTICVKKSVGTTIRVPLASIGIYTANTYTVQLSDKNGLFTSAINIGSKVSNLNVDTIDAIVPISIPSGTGYRMRVTSNGPAVVGSDNGSNITINMASNSISPTGTQSISTGVNGTLLTATEGSTPSSRQWLANNQPIAGQTGKTYLPYFVTPGTYQVNLSSVFACETDTSNTVTINVATPSPHRIYINKAADNSVSLNACNGSFKYNPGDSIILTQAQSPYGRITICGLNNVTIINEDSVYINDYVNGTSVTPGAVVMYNCTNVHFTGTGKTGLRYGITNSSTLGRGFAIEVHGISNNIEFDHLHITGKNVGFAIKEEQADNQCYDSLSFPNLVMHDFKIHDNWINNIVNEGMYLGSTAPNSNDTSANNQHPKVYCQDGSLNTTLTARMGNFDIYNNIIDSTGRGGIQLGSADSGTNRIHDNTVTRSGYNGTYGQGNGIVIGGYTHADIYNNTVRSTTAASIFVLGCGLNRVFNNTIDSSGIRRDGATGTNVPNIEIDTRNTSNPSPGHPNPELLTFQVFDNVVLKKTSSYAIIMDKTYDTYAPVGSYICNSGNVYNFNQIPYSTNCGVTPTIHTDDITGPFCAGASTTVSFTSVGTYNDANSYQVLLSSPTGSFISSTVIGTLPSNANSGSIPVTIPTNVVTASGYKVKVVSINPAVQGNESSAFAINNASNSIAPSDTQYVSTSTNGDDLTVTEYATATSRQWYNGSEAIAGATTSTYTPIFSVPGTYSITCHSTFTGCGVAISNAVIIVDTDIVVPPPQTIVTGNISVNPICVTKTSGATATVVLNSTGTFNSNNIYKVRLSKINGTFGTILNVGMKASTANSETINIVIPPNTPTGTTYRLRGVSTNPSVTGTKSAAFTINLADDTIASAPIQNIYTGADGTTLTVTERSTAISREWYTSSVPGVYNTATGSTSSSYTPNFSVAGTYYVVCKSVYSCGMVTSNPITINVMDEPPPPPPDTVCVIDSNWQHDTIVPKIYHLSVSVPYYRDTTICTYFHFLWIKFLLGCTDYHNLQGYRDSTYDSVGYIHQQTPPHDTTICTITSYASRLGIYYYNPLGTVSVPDIIDTAKNYVGVRNIRYNFTRGGGATYTNNVPVMLDSGMNVFLTVNNSSEGALGFKDFLDSIIQLGKPFVLTGRNEPTQNYLSMANATAELQDAIDVGHANGIKVADGGITKDVIFYMIYYMTNHDQAQEADSIRQALSLNMSSAAAIKAIAQYDTLLNFYKNSALDYINLHGYEPSETTPDATVLSGLLPIVAQFLIEFTGKELITNEMGTYNHNFDVLNDFVNQWIQVGAKYIIYFDGDSGGPAKKNQDYFKTIVESLK